MTSLAAIVYYHLLVTGVFLAVVALAYAYFVATRHRREEAPLDAMIETKEELALEARASLRLAPSE